MSITYFPKLHPDELVYSVLARFYQGAGYPNYILGATDLFLNKTGMPSIEFVNGMRQEVLDILLNEITMEELIEKHTMFPYYGRFLPKETREKAFWALVGMKNTYYDLVKIPTRESRSLCYCAECLKTDREKWGEGYWHRIHQMPGVRICPVHKCYLKDSGVRICSSKSPSLISIEELDLPMDAIKCNDDKECLLAEYVMNVFEAPVNMEADVSIGKYLHSKMYYTKYMAKNGGCRKMKLLYTDFVEYYRNNLHYGLTELWHMEKMLEDKRTNMYEICQLAMFLGVLEDALVEMKMPEKSQQEEFDEKVRKMREQGIGYNRIGRALGVSSLTVRNVGKYVPREKSTYKNGAKKKDWEKIDKELFPEVQGIVKQLYGIANQRPHRITVCTIARKMGINERSMNNLTRCKAEVEKYYETQEQYWAREVIWAMHELQRAGKEISRTQIYALTNMSKANLISCIPELRQIAPLELASQIEALL